VSNACCMRPPHHAHNTLQIFRKISGNDLHMRHISPGRRVKLYPELQHSAGAFLDIRQQHLSCIS
jgi:hypothetical protein